MKIESLDHICTMDTGRWYAIMDENDEEITRYFVDEYDVCSILNERHSEDPSYEGPWMPSLNDEYEQIYTDLSAAYAEELAEELGDLKVNNERKTTMKINTNIILNAIRRADEKKKSFYRRCFEAGHAFDAECGTEKFEIGPCRLSGYWYGATVYARGYEEAEISFEDLRDAVK